MKRRVRASLVVMLGVQTFLAAFLAGVGRVGAVKVWLVMLVRFPFDIDIIRHNAAYVNRPWASLMIGYPEVVVTRVEGSPRLGVCLGVREVFENSLQMGVVTRLEIGEASGVDLIVHDTQVGVQTIITSDSDKCLD